MVGTTLAHYQIESLLGAGGMGEVYRARDTKLNRDVALKVLPEAFTGDVDRLARFKREAQVLASLNHPHIAAIYGLEDANPSTGSGHAVQFLVLELVEGETLAARLTAGPLPLTEALTIARQIAEACQAAHEKGIVHRDLKPANIALATDDQVKVLDFGLAKALEPSAPADIANSPTLSLRATQAGVILGTAAYMSPEQAKGREADKRSDVWAFGAILYEMLTGRRPFDAEDLSTTLAAVIMKDPDWAALPATVPPAIRTLIQRCLEKDRKRRIADISIALFVMDDPAVLSPAGPATATALAPRPAGWQRALPWGLTGSLMAALALVVASWAPWRKTAPSPPQRLSVELGADVGLSSSRGPAIVFSPNGQTLAFVAQKGTAGAPQLYVRRLDELQAKPLSGTDEAGSPFFSPDGQWIGFFTADKLKKISVSGGAAVPICDVSINARGGVWAEDGSIVFQPNGNDGFNLLRVSEAGGKPEPLLALAEGEATQRWPQVLPGGKAVLFTSHTVTGGTYEDASIVVQPLPSGPRKVLKQGGYYGRYLGSGHVVYMHEGTLFGAPFDLDRLDLVGPPVPVLTRVAAAANMGAAQFSVSGNGTLVYLPGATVGVDEPISWIDRTGKVTPMRTATGNWSSPQFSPDGRRLAIEMGTGNSDIWTYEWDRDRLTQLTFDPSPDSKPVWTPDGKRVVFASTRGDKSTFNLWWQRADGTGEPQRLTTSPNSQYPASWDPAGKHLAFYENSRQTSTDLMILPMDGDETSGWRPGQATAFLNTPASETEPMFSPDGRWIAYTSNASGTSVWVRPFLGSGGQQRISTGIANYPSWSLTKHELFFQSPTEQRIMVVSYAVDGAAFHADAPKLWSGAQYEAHKQRSTALHPDGERFAVAPVPEAQTTQQDKVVFVFNFFDELRRIAPATR